MALKLNRSRRKNSFAIRPDAILRCFVVLIAILAIINLFTFQGVMRDDPIQDENNSKQQTPNDVIGDPLFLRENDNRVKPAEIESKQVKSLKKSTTQSSDRLILTAFAEPELEYTASGPLPDRSMLRESDLIKYEYPQVTGCANLLRSLPVDPPENDSGKIKFELKLRSN